MIRAVIQSVTTGDAHDRMELYNIRPSARICCR